MVDMAAASTMVDRVAGSTMVDMAAGSIMVDRVAGSTNLVVNEILGPGGGSPSPQREHCPAPGTNSVWWWDV